MAKKAKRDERKQAQREEKPKKPGKQKKEPVPKEGDPPPTQERERHTCGCESSNTYYFQIGSAPRAGRVRLRVVLTVTSTVVCDPATPDHCEYTYEATAAFQKVLRGRWVADRTRNAFIAKFAVKDPVNSTETPDRVDRTSLKIVDWFPKAPQKDEIDIELKLVASVRGGWSREIKRKANLCVPKLDKPVCPEPN